MKIENQIYLSKSSKNRLIDLFKKPIKHSRQLRKLLKRIQMGEGNFSDFEIFD